ncbi:hypothetical protein [Marinospirillum insulare]|uniref:Uncharacterized protein n=1 Tax=Marinospirillum insulare TaxID=217169 RepID=A0ABQ5ZSX1_9GAMM|nr:hypothetical protein [Marinospirillum insulare]GLR63064.1 hypothetical protein GCM10007878_04990 [Marinospirillum insulare]
MKSGNPTDQLKNKQSGRVSGHDFSILGRNGSANTAIEVMIQVFAELAKDDPQFLERFIARKHGKKRRYVSRNKNELYPDRPDLVESSAIEIIPGWWIGTNYSRKDMQKIINLAKEVARPEAAATIKVQLL